MLYIQGFYTALTFATAGGKPTAISVANTVASIGCQVIFSVIAPTVPFGSFICSTVLSAFISLFNPPPKPSYCYDEYNREVPAYLCRDERTGVAISVNVDQNLMVACYEDAMATAPKSWTAAQLTGYKQFVQKPGFAYPACQRGVRLGPVRCNGKSTATPCLRAAEASYRQIRQLGYDARLSNYQTILNGAKLSSCNCMRGYGPARTCMNCRAPSCNGYHISQC